MRRQLAWVRLADTIGLGRLTAFLDVYYGVAIVVGCHASGPRADSMDDNTCRLSRMVQTVPSAASLPEPSRPASPISAGRIPVVLPQCVTNRIMRTDGGNPTARQHGRLCYHAARERQ